MGIAQSRRLIVSDFFALVNWKENYIDSLYPETNIGLLRLSEEVSFLTGEDIEKIQEYLYNYRDVDMLNDILCENGCNYEIVSVSSAVNLKCEV